MKCLLELELQELEISLVSDSLRFIYAVEWKPIEKNLIL